MLILIILEEEHEDLNISEREENLKRLRENEEQLRLNYEEKERDQRKEVGLMQMKKLEQERDLAINENLMLNSKVLKLEESILIMQKEKKQFLNQLDNYKEEYDKIKAKNNVIELYASQLQRKLDSLTVVNREKESLISDLNNQDWTKRIIQSNVCANHYLF